MSVNQTVVVPPPVMNANTGNTNLGFTRLEKKKGSSRELKEVAGERQQPPSNTAGDIEAGMGDDKGFGAFDLFGSSKVIRGFQRKVYAILCLQMLVTVATICLFIFYKPIKDYVLTDTGTYIYIAALCFFFFIYFILVSSKELRRSTPYNYILLGLFTLSLSYLAGVISSFHNTNIVLMAMGTTAAITVCVAASTFQTKYELDPYFSLIYVTVLAITFTCGGILIAYLTCPTCLIKSFIFGGLIALFLGLFFVCDMWWIMAGGGDPDNDMSPDTSIYVAGDPDNGISPEEYIYVALQVYFDIIYVFLWILKQIGESKSESK